MTKDQLLHEFYKWWLEDANASLRVDRKAGLCSNLAKFTWYSLWRDNFTEHDEEEFWDFHVQVQRQMQLQFVQAGLGHVHPFNISYADYVAECARAACHLNAHRVQWVVSKLEQEEI